MTKWHENTTNWYPPMGTRCLAQSDGEPCVMEFDGGAWRKVVPTKLESEMIAALLYALTEES